MTRHGYVQSKDGKLLGWLKPTGKFVLHDHNGDMPADFGTFKKNNPGFEYISRDAYMQQMVKWTFSEFVFSDMMDEDDGMIPFKPGSIVKIKAEFQGRGKYFPNGDKLWRVQRILRSPSIYNQCVVEEWYTEWQLEPLNFKHDCNPRCREDELLPETDEVKIAKTHPEGAPGLTGVIPLKPTPFADRITKEFPGLTNDPASQAELNDHLMREAAEEAVKDDLSNLRQSNLYRWREWAKKIVCEAEGIDSAKFIKDADLREKIDNYLKMADEPPVPALEGIDKPGALAGVIDRTIEQDKADADDPKTIADPKGAASWNEIYIFRVRNSGSAVQVSIHFRSPRAFFPSCAALEITEPAGKWRLILSGMKLVPRTDDMVSKERVAVGSMHIEKQPLPVATMLDFSRGCLFKLRP